MRLWSIHPRYLDSKGLVALWREGLLAQNVLSSGTSGYKNHPQLNRFKNTSNPEGAIATYLRSIIAEAGRRGYSFDKTKIRNRRMQGKLNVTNGQLDYEFKHLLKKFKARDQERLLRLKEVDLVEAHPLFLTVGGSVENWEVVR